MTQMPTTPIEQKQRVRSIVEAMHAPIVYHIPGWEDTVPQQLKQEVTRQRVSMLDNGGWNEATDADALCYLMTASLAQPFNEKWTHIMGYETALFMPQVRDVADFIPEKLTDEEERELKQLKYKIRQSQIKNWKLDKEKLMGKRKLVIEEFEGGKVLVGVIRSDSDPVTIPKEGTIESVLPSLPEILAGAEEKWKTALKYPSYTPPAPPKVAKKPTAAAKEKTEDLPLLAGKGKETPAAETITVGIQTGGAEKIPLTETPEETKPIGGLVPVSKAIEIAEAQGGSREELETPAEPAAAPVESKVVEYYLKDGRGPFVSVQTAMDAMGMDKQKRPMHNRWDRLSSTLKEAILRRPVNVPSKEGGQDDQGQKPDAATGADAAAQQPGEASTTAEDKAPSAG